MGELRAQSLCHIAAGAAVVAVIYVRPSGATAWASNGVPIWHGSLGLRPATREFGRRIATEGYSVLAPNLFYRANNHQSRRKLGTTASVHNMVA